MTERDEWEVYDEIGWKNTSLYIVYVYNQVKSDIVSEHGVNV